MTILWLVIPCYNEEEVIPETAKRASRVFRELSAKGKISPDSKIAFVNDGSRDKTLEIILDLCRQDDIFACINLSRNRGHQNALLAGLMTAKKYADAVISMDADLQDDVTAIERFVDEYLNGSDVVYGVRSDRKSDTFFKKTTAELFYKFMRFMGVDLVYNHADYRLMSRRAVEGLEEFDEVNTFLRGLVPQVGYPSATVEYSRDKRYAGKSKYPLKKMLSFAFEGITSFSVRPIKMAFALGIFSFLVSICMLCYCIAERLAGNAVSGWASLGVSIWAIGGLQMLLLGVVGEYVGKIYLETKHRPKYIIESVVVNGKKTTD
ncbi:MAG: glycosyltransferase family 2 protein [Clostridiales bacterium]|nr:glycosyltransferase family 2 protein [Clostridiales bacterium]